MWAAAGFDRLEWDDAKAAPVSQAKETDCEGGLTNTGVGSDQ